MKSEEFFTLFLAFKRIYYHFESEAIPRVRPAIIQK